METLSQLRAEHTSPALRCGAPLRHRKDVLVVASETASIRKLLGFVALNYDIRRPRTRLAALNSQHLATSFAVILGERPSDLRIGDFCRRLKHSGLRPPLIVFVGRRGSRWISDTLSQTDVDGLIFSDLPADDQIRQFKFLAGETMDRTLADSDPRIADIWDEAKDTMNDLSTSIAQGHPIVRSSVRRLAKSVIRTLDDRSFNRLLALLKDHHSESAVHCLDVAITALLLGRHIGVQRNSDEIRLFEIGLLHDLGKLAVPPHVLEKPGKLSQEEFALIRNHPVDTAKIMQRSGGFDEGVMNAALRHHEKLDGTGYPDGLAGAEIDDLSRLIAVCDVFCALTERRSYHAARSPEQAIPILKDLSGHHLDPLFVDRLIEVTTGEEKRS